MHIFDHKLNITDYLMIVATFALIAEFSGKLNAGGKVHIELYGLVAGVFLLDKLVRVAIRAVGGYRNFRRILLLLTISPVLYFLVWAVATNSHDFIFLAAMSVPAYGALAVFYLLVERAIIGDTEFVQAVALDHEESTFIDTMDYCYKDIAGTEAHSAWGGND